MQTGREISAEVQFTLHGFIKLLIANPFQNMAISRLISKYLLREVNSGEYFSKFFKLFKSK